MLQENKVVMAKLKIYLPAGEAKATPPLGPLLGQYGVNTVQFCKEFNELTEGFVSFFNKEDLKSDVLIDSFELIIYIYIYDDRKFSFDICKPSTSFLLRLLAGVGKGNPRLVPYTLSYIDLLKIALFKYPEERLYSSAMMIKGTARSIGITIV